LLKFYLYTATAFALVEVCHQYLSNFWIYNAPINQYITTAHVRAL